MKKFLVACIAFIMSLTVVFSGCSLLKGENGADGKDGKDGQDLSIREIWETYKEETNNPDLTFADFLDLYFSDIQVDKTEETSLQSAMNYSLMSGVSIISTFKYKETNGYRESSGGYYKIRNKSFDYQEVYVGSGVIVDMNETTDEAYVVTNCHVIYSDTSTNPVCQDVRLYLYGQDTDGVNYDIKSYYVYDGLDKVYTEVDEEYVEELITTKVENDKSGITATVVGASVNYDIALLKLKTSDILEKNPNAVAAVFDNADKVSMGEAVYAVGFPGGEGMSVTQGRVTKEDDYSSYSLNDYPVNDSDYHVYRVFRTDAAINGGNSGGAMYNSDGKIVGIVCSKKVGEDYDNLGYVLPASNVRRLWQLMRYKQSTFNSASKVPEISRNYLAASYKADGTSTFWDAESNHAEYIEKVVLTTVQSGFGLASGEVVTHITIKNGDTVIEDKDVTRAYHLDDLMLSYRTGYSVYLTTTQHTTPVKVTVQ